MNTSFHCRAALLLALTVITSPLSADQLPPKEAPTPPPPPAPEPAAISASAVESGLRTSLEQVKAEAVRAAHEAHARWGSLRLGFNGANTTRTLVLPAVDASAEQLGQIREELAIMSRLLAKATDPESAKRGGFRINLGDIDFGQTTDLDALYLDGYGAVFLLEVDYPLVEPAKVAEKKTEPKPDKDAAWEKARREINGTDHDSDLDAADDDAPAEPAGVPYDAEKVAALRQRLLEVFRHATNLKAVKPGEDIVLRISGRSVRPPHVAQLPVYITNPTMTKRYGVQAFATSSPSEPIISTLTLRAKKSDVDAFATGQLSAEEFARKVAVNQRDDSGPAK
jgi:hypothetical protein